MGFRILSKRLNCFYPSSAFCQSGISSGLFCKVNYLNKYGFQPPCPPCHLFQPFDWLKGCFVYTSKTVLSSLPPVRRGILHERRSVLFAFALPSVRGTTACFQTICRGTFPRRPTARPFKPSGLPVTIEYHVPPWLNIYFCCEHMDKTRKNYRFL